MGTSMESKNDETETEKRKNLSFECDGCGGCFESWDRLRQHQVDCQSDEFETVVLGNLIGAYSAPKRGDSLRHRSFANVWALGDVMNAPNAKTAAAARKQAPAVAENVVADIAGRGAVAQYDGYGSCPLTVERGKIVLAEFGYGGVLKPSFPAWLLGHQPSAQIICASYAQDLAEKLARDCRTVMTSPFYRALFATRLSPQRQSVAEFMTTALGFRLATSVGGVLTGRGADYLIIDDPLKPEEALSQSQRQHANDWFDHTLYSRLNSKECQPNRDE